MAKGKHESAQQISDEKVAKIRADIAVWTPGCWAEQVAQGPACSCGLARSDTEAIRKRCHRHGEERDDT